MKLSLKKVAVTVLGLYIVVTCYTAYVLIRRKVDKSGWEGGRSSQVLDVADDPNWNPWGQEFEKEGAAKSIKQTAAFHFTWDKSDHDKANDATEPKHGDKVVEIWGKAAIGLYLWEHLLNGQLEDRLGGIWRYGKKRVGSIFFRFRTGPGVVPAKVPADVKNLVLVLNGREPAKVEFATMWLDFLPNLQYLQNVAVVLLGNEQCDNKWIFKYLESQGGKVKFVFLVYDSPEIDDHNFYQWPLGVATYRDFPVLHRWDIDVEAERDYCCNFLGTVYPNSSRETLLRVIHKHQLQELCYINPRKEWLPQETDDTREDYMRALAQSDLTLCPVGKNTECYRLYEAIAYGSVPIVENKMTPGRCGQSNYTPTAPLHILKQYKAPFIFISDWSELPDILEDEKGLSNKDIRNRRKNILNWYEEFKNKMKVKFVTVLKQRFFTPVR